MRKRTNVQGGLADSLIYSSLHLGMRIVLDEMREDPYPVSGGIQGTVKDRDDAGDVQMRWDNGSELKLLDIDSFHVVSGDDELSVSFEYLKKQQEKGYDVCPRCGKTFDVRRGAVSRRIRKLNISVRDLCGQQEAIEDFVNHSTMPLTDWYQVKLWQGRAE